MQVYFWTRESKCTPPAQPNPMTVTAPEAKQAP